MPQTATLEKSKRSRTPLRTRQEDHFVVLRGATWADYQRILEIRGDKSAPRITYLEGVLQIMSPSRSHEAIKSVIGCLVEAWCMAHEIEFGIYGSWTLEDKRSDRGVEPDECYIFGDQQDVDRPHLAIEVVWTHGGIDKLEVYRKLDVAEVWFWDDGTITPYRLRDEQYQAVAASEALPDIDLEQLGQFVEIEPTSRAIREYKEAISS